MGMWLECITNPTVFIIFFLSLPRSCQESSKACMNSKCIFPWGYWC
jgi:hypothetical protein